jgi:tyrosyl-tRNA synthetase
VSDANVFDYLRIFTFLPVDNITKLEGAEDSAEKYQYAKSELAYAVTALVHGRTTADAVRNVSEVLFGSKLPKDLSKLERELLLKDAPCSSVTKLELTSAFLVADLLVRSGLATSKSEARSLIEAGGVSINGAKVESPNQTLASGDLAHGFALLRRGKKNFTCIQIKK